MNVESVRSFWGPLQLQSRAYNYLVLIVRDEDDNDRRVVCVDLSIVSHEAILARFKEEHAGFNVEALGGGHFTVRPEGSPCVLLFPSWPKLGKDPNPDERIAYLKEALPGLEVDVIGRPSDIPPEAKRDWPTPLQRRMQSGDA